MRARHCSTAFLVALAIVTGSVETRAHGGHGGHGARGARTALATSGSSHYAQQSWCFGHSGWRTSSLNGTVSTIPPTVVDYPDDLPEARLGRFLGHVFHRHEN
jgi:hypothetical protein